MGKVITDEELAAAKRSVQPDHDLFYTFSSVMAVFIALSRRSPTFGS